MNAAISFVDQGDQAATASDFGRAVTLLQRATADEADNPQLWMKLAALHRRLRQPEKALQSINQALSLAERDFVALCFKATLLEQVAPDTAGEARLKALIQRPEGELPSHLHAAITRGTELRDRWLDERERRLAAAVGPAVAAATQEEFDRIVRFQSNKLRKTRVYHCDPTEFHFPGLPEREFQPRSQHPWLPLLEDATDIIASELDAVMKAARAELVPYVEYDDHAPLTQWRELNRSLDWTAIHLLRNGDVVEANADYCPRTMEILATLPHPFVPGAGPNAMFSLLAPRTTIPAHVGVSSTRLVCHLSLVVPQGCWFRVGAETRLWKRGEAFVFDDTIEHEAANPSDQLRVVLIFDVWHPFLTETERDAVTRIIGAETGVSGAL